MSIIRSIIDIALRHAEGRRVTAVEVGVGRWSNIEPSCLDFYFQGMIAETSLEGASLRILEVPLRAECAECETQFEPEDMVFYCPACGSRLTEVISGKELRVKAIEVAYED
ncbi:MAG: hydrogenase maturation nickel metallochaperone HypA [Armatimonadetes bacterium]|nr:hydrogenase maturation nickel metallochaperone HypA [Armatimonadota bacterium]